MGIRHLHVLACSLVLLQHALPALAHGLEFDMMFQAKCVMEDLAKNTLAVGDFSFFQKDNPSHGIAMDIKVRPCIQIVRS